MLYKAKKNLMKIFMACLGNFMGFTDLTFYRAPLSFYCIVSKRKLHIIIIINRLSYKSSTLQKANLINVCVKS